MRSVCMTPSYKCSLHFCYRQKPENKLLTEEIVLSLFWNWKRFYPNHSAIRYVLTSSTNLSSGPQSIKHLSFKFDREWSRKRKNNFVINSRNCNRRSLARLVYPLTLWSQQSPKRQHRRIPKKPVSSTSPSFKQLPC